MELFLVIVLLWLRVQNSILSPLKSELGIPAITLDNWFSVGVSRHTENSPDDGRIICRTMQRN